MAGTGCFRFCGIAWLLVFSIACMVPLDLSAQDKKTTTYEQIWLGYFNQSRFSNKWGSWVDLHLRTEDDFVEGISQGIIRLGLTYYIRDQVKATVGYAYVHHFPGDNHKNVAMPEHRPWQQLQWHTNNSRVRSMQWIRLEERFRRKILNDDELAEGYNFNFRVRYNYFIQWAIGARPFKKGSFSYVLNDEVHINFGDQIVYNYFDQNRFFTGFQYFLSDHSNLQFGYMNLFQQTAAGNRYRSIHALRLFFFQNLDFRKKHG